jgi:hypothetical protein
METTSEEKSDVGEKQEVDKQDTDMRRLTTGIYSEKCVVKRCGRCANVYLHKPHTSAIWYSLLLLGYKPL